MSDAIDNAIDDMLLARAAGTGPQFDGDTSFMYPPHPHAAQPGHMPTVADIINERNHWRARAEIAEAQRDVVPRKAIERILNAIILPARHEDDQEAIYAWLEATRPQEASK